MGPTRRFFNPNVDRRRQSLEAEGTLGQGWLSVSKAASTSKLTRPLSPQPWRLVLPSLSSSPPSWWRWWSRWWCRCCWRCTSSPPWPPGCATSFFLLTLEKRGSRPHSWERMPLLHKSVVETGHRILFRDDRWTAKQLRKEEITPCFSVLLMKSSPFQHC